jgi:hypothetical protein
MAGPEPAIRFSASENSRRGFYTFDSTPILAFAKGQFGHFG